jgi:Domain of unknown function (DUF4375)
MSAPAAAQLNVVVSAESVQEGDDAVVSSNVTLVNALLTELLTEDEIATNALRSYYVDFYLTQVLNGGFAQYIFNSGWKAELNERVLEGLNLMGADAHARLFEKAVAAFEDLDEDEKDFFLSDAFFDDLDEDDLEGDWDEDPDEDLDGDGSARNSESMPHQDEDEDEDDDEDEDEEDIFDEIDEDFYALNDSDDLVARNAAWLRSLPELQVIPRDGLEDYVGRRVAEIPDLPERQEAAARYLAENMPEFERIIRVLTETAGQDLEAITLGDPQFKWQGETAFAWHFTTDQGEYLMVERENEALMIDGDTREIVASVEFEDDDEDADDEEQAAAAQASPLR